MNLSKVCIRGISISLLVILGSACISKPIEKGPEITKLTPYNFRNLVTKQAGPVLVYYSKSFVDQNVIKAEFENLFEENNELVKFAQFEVNSENETKYQVTKLPAVNYYYDGILIDQLATLPVQVDSQLDLVKDIQLWFYETVLSPPNQEKQFTYVFNGGHHLDFNPY